MALEQKLSLKLAQKLVMTPSLQQAIKLLQMTRMELQTVVAQELVENPVLEEGDETFEDETASEDGEETAEAEAEETAVEELDHQESMDDIDLEAYFNDYLEGSTAAFDLRSPRSAAAREHADPGAGSLRPSALAAPHDRCPRAAARDRRADHRQPGSGRIPGGHRGGDTARWDGEGEPGSAYTPEEVEEALTVRPGIRSRPEWPVTTLQGEPAPAARRSRRARGLAGSPDPRRSTGTLFLKQAVSADRQADRDPAGRPRAGGGEYPRACRLRPGRKFSTERTHYVEPDVYVTKVGGKYVIQLNDDGMPRLRISSAYRRMLQHYDERWQGSRCQAVHQGEDALRGLADQEPGSTSADHLQGRRLHRSPAAGLPGARHRVSAADGAARRRRRHRHARVDGQSRGVEQVHAHAARSVPDEVLLPQRHRPRVRRRHLVA